MKKAVSIAIGSVSAALIIGGYWLFVLRKKRGVSRTDAEELSNYVLSDKPIADEKTQTISNVFKDSFKNVFPERTFK